MQLYLIETSAKSFTVNLVNTIFYSTPPDDALYGSCNEIVQFIKDKETYIIKYLFMLLNKLTKFKILTTLSTELEFHAAGLRKNFTLSFP